MSTDIFDILILIGRPASGKSEIIDFLSHLPPQERRRYHIGELDVLDDFPMLWAWFEEDHLLEKKFHRPRLHTDSEGYFLHNDLWHLLIERLSLEYHKLVRDHPNYHDGHTALIEFSRGSEHGGYAQAFQHLSDEILTRAAIVYVKVSFAESLRKNRRRYNPNRPDSILEHALPDEKLKRLYGDDDFERIAPDPSGFLTINGFSVPYAVFENEDDVTTNTPDLLAARLDDVLGSLWKLYRERI
ncbi:MAG: hypothetical protein D6770_02420 [Anaerolineae bacterium]|nr:MAG: hypothetical protein D6770_02420 [Anaerolineae bacterium]